MKNKNKLLSKYNIVFPIVGVIAAVILIVMLTAHKKEDLKTQTVASSTVSTQIMASGTVRSLNEATLHFQTGGKVIYLPFKEGDYVNQGQTIASLDTYTIQKQLEIALNNYRSTRDTFDQQQNNSQNGILQNQQKTAIESVHAGIGGQNEVDVINDAAKRILDQNQATLDNSVIQVQLTNYAFSLANLTTPVSGVLVHEDITNAQINVTPTTSFVIADPNALVFRANIAEDEIGYITEGEKTTVTLASQKNIPIEGTVLKIYPEKMTLPTGENVYQADISVEKLSGITNYNQDGEVLITNKYEHPVTLVPSWLIEGNQYLWVDQDNKPVLKKVSVGDTINNKSVINDGLSQDDKIILNPRGIAEKYYIKL